MLSMKQLEEARPSWTNRRPIILWTLIFMGVLILLSIVASVALALLAKFGFYIFCIFITVIISCFAGMVAIIGSYVFGARWETKDYLNMLKDVVPNIKRDEDGISN